MKTSDVTIAIFDDHPAADTAVKVLGEAGFDIKNLSVVGQGYHTDETVVGFYNIGDRVAFWGSRGAFWGGLWGLFVGGLFVTAPVVGPLIVLGAFAGAIIMAVETAAVVGGISALTAALVSLSIPKDSVIRYEEAIKADKFLVMAHGSAEDMRRAKSILANASAAHVEVFSESESRREALASSIVHGTA
ncbi:hypothetical protein AEAC466_18270 [Asticcacaulis sp. AC466]|uniref:hypothetical protein n=1 Tax=Asticcacaulis sp. AC466 TaxID=1282362 RepID=UPI0003C3FEA3|nr:hypothetical protein [Asticcacaulis sp. AC466]ESQ82293.1 hypothetical protein AEAC466_18270 [Asticcacaulis sp. AC466]